MKFLLLLLGYSLCWPAWAQETSLSFSQADTSIHWILDSRLHTVHGTFRLKEGHLHFDRSTGAASGELIVDAVSGESGNGARDSRMHSSILESKRFGTIVFRPDRVNGQVPSQGSGKIEVHGTFELHGKTHELTMPIDLQVSDRVIAVKSQFRIPYVEWGLKDPSAFMLKVDNTVQIQIAATATAESAR